MCRLGGGTSNVFLGQLFTMIQQFSNYSYKCPIQKGTYVISNLKTGALVFPIKTFDFLFRLKTFALLSDRKKHDTGIIQVIGKYSFD